MVTTKKKGFVVLALMVVALAVFAYAIITSEKETTADAHATYVEDFSHDFTLHGESEYVFFGEVEQVGGNHPINDVAGDCAIPRTNFKVNPYYEHKGDVQDNGVWVLQEGGRSCTDPTVTELVNDTPRMTVGRNYMFFVLKEDEFGTGNQYTVIAQPYGLLPIVVNGVDRSDNLKFRFTFDSPYTQAFDDAHPSPDEDPQGREAECFVPEGGTVPCEINPPYEGTTAQQP